MHPESDNTSVGGMMDGGRAHRGIDKSEGKRNSVADKNIKPEESDRWAVRIEDAR